MNGFDTHDDQRPVMWLRGYPLYAAHFIVLVFVVSMLLTTLFLATGGSAWLGALTFNSTDVLRGQIWRVGTYGLVNPPSLWFVIDMFMIAWFGRELERAFGRRTFLWLYGCLYLLTPFLFTLIGLWRPMSLSGQTGGFALFVAFATLYPNVPMLFNILAKWAAVILVGLNALISLSNRDMIGLVSLFATVGFAYVFVRQQQGLFQLPKFELFKPKPKLRVLPDLKPTKPAPSAAAKDLAMAEVDALLDKIAQSGIASLTAAERARLDAAQADLQRKKSARR